MEYIRLCGRLVTASIHAFDSSMVENFVVKLLTIQPNAQKVNLVSKKLTIGSRPLRGSLWRGELRHPVALVDVGEVAQ